MLRYLDVCDNFQGDGCQVERIHCKIHQVPPVVYILVEASVPHLLDFSPNKTCGKRVPVGETPLWSTKAQQIECREKAVKKQQLETSCFRPPIFFSFLQNVMAPLAEQFMMQHEIRLRNRGGGANSRSCIVASTGKDLSPSDRTSFPLSTLFIARWKVYSMQFLPPPQKSFTFTYKKYIFLREMASS